jgi:sulfoxide reductase heme-binding subunit YedZ
MEAALSPRASKALAFAACLYPLAEMAGAAWSGALGANPIEAVTRGTGKWALVFLLITLAITPLRRLTGRNGLVRFRRLLGLFAFFYASLHLFTYLWLDQFFDVPEIAKDIVKRPFVTVGFLAFAMLVPLAATSSAGMIRRLGRRWQQLHRLVYASAAAGVLHFLWLVKADTRRPLLYGAVLGALLGLRLLIRRPLHRGAGKGAVR